MRFGFSNISRPLCVLTLAFVAGTSAVQVSAEEAGAITAAAQPVCAGNNLFDSMPAEKRARIDEAVSRIPFHRGILWRATKDDQQITMVGTYHFQDPRHQIMLDRLAPAYDNAAIVMVEAGPEEETRLKKALVDDPNLMVNSEGPTLPERLSPEDWHLLADAMSARGTPPFVTAKLKPWYVSMLLGISPCMMKSMNSDQHQPGLDQMLVAEARAADIPVRALEPWDTVFALFADLTPEQEEEMIRTVLPAAQYADDYAVTMTEAYFGGDVWAIWEFGRFDAYDNSGLTREQVDQQMRLAQEKLMDQRNKSWIEPLTQAASEAASQGKGVLAGFGALHLPGEAGVLNLLLEDGWKIERLDG